MEAFRKGLYSDSFEQKAIRSQLELLERTFHKLDRGFGRRYAIPYLADDLLFERVESSSSALEAAGFILSNTHGLMQFFSVSTGQKALVLAQGLVDAYNTQNLVMWMLVGRTLIEHCASFFYFKERIDESRPCKKRFFVSEVRALDGVLNRFMKGSRYDWGAILFDRKDWLTTLRRQGYQPVEPKEALAALQRRDGVFKGIFCHPNMGSHLLVMTVPEAGASRPDVTLTPTPGGRRNEFVLAITVPAITACFGELLKGLQEVGKIHRYWIRNVLNGRCVVRPDPASPAS